MPPGVRACRRGEDRQELSTSWSPGQADLSGQAACGLVSMRHHCVSGDIPGLLAGRCYVMREGLPLKRRRQTALWGDIACWKARAPTQPGATSAVAPPEALQVGVPAQPPRHGERTGSWAPTGQLLQAPAVAVPSRHHALSRQERRGSACTQPRTPVFKEPLGSGFQCVSGVRTHQGM